LNLIEHREASFISTKDIIDRFKNQQTIGHREFLDAFDKIVIEQRFENNTNGFEKAQSSELFDSKDFLTIRNLIRDYKKVVDDVKFREYRQNSSSEIMEAELLRNGFYDNAWTYFRSYYRPEEFDLEKENINFSEEINRFGEVKAIFMRSEWATPAILNDYQTIISIGDKLKMEIDKYLNIDY